MTKKTTVCLNCVYHRDSHLFYKKMIKGMLKKIPKTELVNILIELKILKQDYLTKEITSCEVKDV